MLVEDFDDVKQISPTVKNGIHLNLRSSKNKNIVSTRVTSKLDDMTHSTQDNQVLTNLESIFDFQGNYPDDEILPSYSQENQNNRDCLLQELPNQNSSARYQKDQPPQQNSNTNSSWNTRKRSSENCNISTSNTKFQIHDEKYYDKRARNNFASVKCRVKKKKIMDSFKYGVIQLENNVNYLFQEISSIKSILFQILQQNQQYSRSNIIVNSTNCQ